MSKDSGSKKNNAPSMRLQAKDSLNFTGLKDYFIDGKLSGYAYGYPLQDATYSAKKKPNPFIDYKQDGFLFLVHQNEKATAEQDKIRPSYIELVVLEGAKVLVSSYCKQRENGIAPVSDNLAANGQAPQHYCDNLTIKNVCFYVTFHTFAQSM